MTSKTSLVLAMTIGDGHIDKHDRLMIKHSVEQKEYLFWKAKLLQPYQVPKVYVADYQSFDSRTKKTYYTWQLVTRQRPVYRIVKKWLYRKGKKTLTRKLLNKLNALGLAIWFMDDGNTAYQYNSGKYSYQPHSILTTLSTQVSYEENQVLVEYFKECWGITPWIVKSGNQYRLNFTSDGASKLAQIIEPHVIPSMMYKIEKLLHKMRSPRGLKYSLNPIAI